MRAYRKYNEVKTGGVGNNAGMTEEERLMYSNNCNGSGAAWERGFVAVCATLAMGLGLMARPAEAQPFAYVTNDGSPELSR